jgi:hypothetical protein
MTEYQPGVCNIGKAEQRKRYGLGLAGATATVILSALLLTGIISIPGFVGVLIASALMFEGFIQGYMNFCTGFASKGIYDVSESGDEKKEVKDSKQRKQDKVKALQIHLYSISGAIAVTAGVFLALNI